ncbi:hypothetical protein [Rhizobium sullae]|uniref:Uncharacterized protein n=1 Tax=Rhizobium sullae TaxID=50338 RepID=A0A4V2V8L6_RHISU|nr:hypothetical protein [Rhizobium sullae]TCU13755.1 hypothetical protein EV132_111188 [Rhizobium sullae]
MTLEEFTAKLNSSTFWKEFTYSETRFSPRPKQQVELADGIVLIGSLAYVFQLKERTGATEDPEAEGKWFRNKVLGKATKQIRDTLGYLSAHQSIQLTNTQGHSLEVRGAELSDIKKVIVFLATDALPRDCRETQFYISDTAGFMHVIAAQDYLGVLDTLRVPNDIRLYFEYRKSVLPRLREAGTVVEEPDIMVAFLSEFDLPVPGSRERLRAFVQDLEAFDLTSILGDLLAHIQNPDPNHDYYRILLEFARSSRSVWREFKLRLVKSLDACRAGNPCRPFRFTVSDNDCTFMIAPLDPDWPSAGPDGERMRTNALLMFTEAAKYAAKSTKGVGLLVSKDGDHICLDWCLLDYRWEKDAKIENLLATTDLFRDVKERMLDSFFFRTD